MDIFENVMTFTLVSQFPRPTNVIGGLIGYVTVTKFSLLFASLLVPLVVFGLFRTHGAKAPTPSTSNQNLSNHHEQK